MDAISPDSLNEEFKNNSDQNFNQEVASGDLAGEASFKNESSFESSSSEKDDSYSRIISKIKNDDENDNNSLNLESSITHDAASVSMKTDAESQIQHLIDVAMEKGIMHSIKVAKHLEDNYVLDSFHDRLLADDLHDALINKGLIEKD